MAWFWAGKVGPPQRIGLHRGSLLFEEHSPLPLKASASAVPTSPSFYDPDANLLEFWSPDPG